jgi:hypothetical protein
MGSVPAQFRGSLASRHTPLDTPPGGTAKAVMTGRSAAGRVSGTLCSFEGCGSRTPSRPTGAGFIREPRGSGADMSAPSLSAEA